MAGAAFMNLPLEVLSLIFIIPSDLVAIRSVCKKFCQAVDRLFALEYFATRDHVALTDLLHLDTSSTSPLGALLHPSSDDQTLLRRSLSGRSFRLRYLDQWEVRYKHSERFLGIREMMCDLSVTEAYHGLFHALLASNWLSNIELHSLKILGLSLLHHGPEFSIDSLIPHLKTLTCITFGSMGLDDEEDWSNVIELLSTAPKLVLCRFYDLHTQFLSAFNQEQKDDRMIKDGVIVTSVPGGHVPDPAVDVRLGNVSANLKDIAATLAADTASWMAGEEYDMQLTRADESEDDGYLAGLTLEDMLFDITGRAYGLPPLSVDFFAGV